MDEFKRRMDGGVKLALEIDRMEKERVLTTTEAIIESMKRYDFDEDEILDILFALTKQGTLVCIHDLELERDIYKISR